MSSRQSAVAGMFYPESCKEIERYIDQFNQTLDDADYTPPTDFVPRALIAPHAGYVYSGFTANIVYRTAALNITGIKRVIIIGPSHKVFISGASIALYERYESPCGDLRIDLPFSTQLENKVDFLQFQPDAHQDHSTEVQVPFIRHYLGNIDIVEIVYGQVDYLPVSQLIDTLLEDKNNFIVISTDLSHFHDINKARILDNLCIKGIADLDLEQLDHGCEACGITGVKAIVNSAQSHHLTSKVLDYRTSADASGDESRVVGYTSSLIG